MGLSLVRIRDLVDGLFDGPHATPPPADSGPIFLGIHNITDDGRLVLEDVRHINEDDFDRWTKRVIPQAGDIVFTYEATLNRYAIIPVGFRGCLGRRLALLRVTKSKANARYLHYAFFSKEWRATIRANTLIGATVDRIPLSKFLDFPICVHARKDQDAVADVLSAYDDLIENNTKRIKILEEMAGLLYREWFVEFRFPDHQASNKAVQRLPPGWALVRIADLVDQGLAQVTTGPFGTQLHASDYVEHGTPVINVRNIGFGELRTEKLEYVDDATVARLNQHLLAEGDIVFGRKGAVERHVLVGRSEDRWLQGSDCLRLRLRANAGTSPRLLSQQFLLEDHKQWMKNQGSHAATMASLNQAIIGRIQVLLPPPEILHRADEELRTLTSLAARLREANQVLRSTRDILLPRLLSGEIELHP